jgi:hypothetical protein
MDSWDQAKLEAVVVRPFVHALRGALLLRMGGWLGQKPSGRWPQHCGGSGD